MLMMKKIQDKIINISQPLLVTIGIIGLATVLVSTGLYSVHSKNGSIMKPDNKKEEIIVESATDIYSLENTKPIISTLTPQQSQIYERFKRDKTKGLVHSVDMRSNVGPPDSYKELSLFLSSLPAEDIVVLKLHNLGGYSHGLNYIINSITNTKALVISHVDAPSFSAGALLACSTPVTIVDPYSYLMYHSGSIGSLSGNLADIRARLLNDLRENTRVLNMCVQKGILSTQQVKDINEGKDQYIYPEDINDNVLRPFNNSTYSNKHHYYTSEFKQNVRRNKAGDGSIELLRGELGKSYKTNRVEISRNLQQNEYQYMYQMFDRLKRELPSGSGAKQAKLKILFNTNIDVYAELNGGNMTVYITTGFIGFMDEDKDALACVLGHELYQGMKVLKGAGINHKEEFENDIGGRNLASKAGYDGCKGCQRSLNRLAGLVGLDVEDQEHPSIRSRLTNVRCK